MRVIAGEAKGRVLKAVPGLNTRPTTDKVKEAIFSIIGPYFEGEQVLDLFAGTGGLGIEALSRGAGHAVFIDLEPSSIEAIRTNVAAAKVGSRAEIYRNTAVRALKLLAKRQLAFELVFLDPPYRMSDMDECMLSMAEAGLLQPQATIVVEHAASQQYAERFGLFVQRKRVEYGETTVTIYTYDPNIGGT